MVSKIYWSITCSRGFFCLIWCVCPSAASRCTFVFPSLNRSWQHKRFIRIFIIHKTILLQFWQNKNQCCEVHNYTNDMNLFCWDQNRPRRSVNVLRNVRRATLDGNTGPIHSNSSRFLSFMALWNSSSDITPSRSTSSFFNSESIKSYDAINACVIIILCKLYARKTNFSIVDNWYFISNFKFYLLLIN